MKCFLGPEVKWFELIKPTKSFNAAPLRWQLLSLIAQEHLVDATPEAEAAPTACNLVEKLQGSANLSPLPVLSPKLITEHQHGCDGAWAWMWHGLGVPVRSGERASLVLADVAATAAHTYRAYNKLLRHVNAPTLVGLRLETAPSDMDPPSRSPDSKPPTIHSRQPTDRQSHRRWLCCWLLKSDFPFSSSTL